MIGGFLVNPARAQLPVARWRQELLCSVTTISLRVFGRRKFFCIFRNLNTTLADNPTRQHPITESAH
jgi:hypothetical protein